ncbi:MAG: hypothetical protein ACJA02_000821, partial [Myxococcota bacterium]
MSTETGLEDFQLGSTDDLHAHHVLNGINYYISEMEDVLVIPVMTADGSRFQNPTDDLNKMPNKKYPLTLIVPYCLGTNHYEISIVKFSTIGVVATVDIYNVLKDGKGNAGLNIHDIITRKTCTQNVPGGKEETVYGLGIDVGKVEPTFYKNNEDGIIFNADGRCGDAVIAIARLAAVGMEITTENLGHIYDIET